MDERTHDLGRSHARMTTAVHEAAHAVVALSLDLPVNGLTLRSPVVPDPDDGAGEDSFDSMLGSLGLSFPADYTDELYPRLAGDTIVASLAGPLAEMRISGTIDLMGSYGDITEALATAQALRGDREAFALVRECQQEALEIVEREWATILAVAAELVDAPDGVLDGDAVREAVRTSEVTARP